MHTGKTGRWNDPAEVEELKRLWDEGMTAVAISKVLGRDRDSVRSKITSLILPLRDQDAHHYPDGVRRSDTPAERMRRWRAAHREEYLEKHREHERHRRSTPHGKRAKKNSSLLKAYGITIEQFEAMAAEQNGICPICTKSLDMGFSTHVDHCHKTEKIRGLLCSQCNTAIGQLGECVDTLRRAIEYLGRA